VVKIGKYILELLLVEHGKYSRIIEKNTLWYSDSREELESVREEIKEDINYINNLLRGYTFGEQRNIREYKSEIIMLPNNHYVGVIKEIKDYLTTEFGGNKLEGNL